MPLSSPLLRRFIRTSFALFFITGVAFAQVPSTDIFVFDVNQGRLENVQRVTDREGYDNQPKFLPDGERLVYSSMRGAQTDIYLYDLKRNSEAKLTASPQSEYSPTPVPGTDAISFVRDFGNLKQQLWSQTLDGKKSKQLLGAVNPVGYHSWVDAQSLMLFVLGEPHTLQLATVGDQPGTVLADSPGRAITKIPNDGRMSFVDKSGESWWLTAIRPDGTKERLVETPDQREDYDWAPDGSAWFGDDSRVLRWDPKSGAWSEIADLDSAGVRNITRITFSANGQRLAIVGSRSPNDLGAAYRREAGQILGAALSDDEGWEKLSYMATEIGHRLSGSRGLEIAIDWAAETMELEGLQVRKQPVKVPHWVRGDESAAILEPLQRPMPMLGLGLSVGTPPEGVQAPVVVVRNFDELDALERSQVEGKIVVYAVEWLGYGGTVRYRSRGASRAAEKGAIAVLVRSATGLSLQTPHTGALSYDDEQPKIPAAAITPEDADWIRRKVERGHEVVVELKMQAQLLEDADSFNVIVEIPGSERPEEVVVMGGHYDSWDVGEGVHDDGAACIAAWQALKLISDLGLKPRRTLRVVLWTNEENGLRGGRAYHEDLNEEEVGAHVAAIEMDGGCERPVGYGFGLSGVDPNAEEKDPRYERAYTMLQQIASLTAPIDADEISRGGGGADIGPLMRDGVPGLGLRTVGEHYFDWHHTRADTLDKVDPQDFRRAIALLGVMGYVLADMPERLVPAP
jgi:hypothetical protein